MSLFLWIPKLGAAISLFIITFTIGFTAKSTNTFSRTSYILIYAGLFVCFYLLRRSFRRGANNDFQQITDWALFVLLAPTAAFVASTLLLPQLAKVASLQNNPKVITFDLQSALINSPNLVRSAQIDYSPRSDNYYVFVPKSTTPDQTFGLIVYISANEIVTELPPGWEQVLTKRHFILIAPERAGNHCYSEARRMGFGVLGALAAQNKYKIDRKKIYIAGISGGARTAGDAAFYQSDVFSGTIQSCGTDFCQHVPRQLAANETDSNGFPYGYVEVSDENQATAKSKVHFVLITGPNDFRHGNILDIYNGGFKPQGYHCLLLDVPGMGHQDASGESLEKALDYIESKN
jgi:hypothetical protein